MTTEQLEKAKQSGAITARELDIWYSGYLQGQKDTFEEVTKDVKEASDDLSFLDEDFTPTSITHYTNKG